ncbi:MAG: nucleotide exchange factor GrpE [Candidatus Omnitrophota bacterium]
MEKHQNAKDEDKAEDIISIPAEELNKLQEKAAAAADFQDKYLRAHAEFENYKKRLDKERAEFLKFASQSIILELLKVLDDFDRALDAAKNSKDFALLSQGLEMTRKDLYEILENWGLTRIGTVSEKFDPAKHEAVATVDTQDTEEDVIVEELQKGYMLNDRVIRPAKVKVAKRQGG